MSKSVRLPQPYTDILIPVVAAILTPAVIDQHRTLKGREGRDPTEEEMQSICAGVATDWSKMVWYIQGSLKG